MNELPKLKCQETRRKQLIVTCTNKAELEMIKEKIEEREEIKQKIEIREPKQKQARIIIFGAPEAPTPSRRHDKQTTDASSQDNITELEIYDKQILQPSLERVLRNKDINHIIIKVLRGRSGEGTSHIVIQLPEIQAIRLIKEKFPVGFNMCTAKRYVTVLRCFHCQQYGYAARNCQNDEACAKCGRGHNARDCESRRLDCVNCRIEVEKHGGNYRQAGVQTQHAAYDPMCRCYIKKKNEALASLDRSGKNSN